MKKEYDFSNAEIGKFYVKKEDMDYPIYLNKKIQNKLAVLAKSKKTSVTTIVNNYLKKDLEKVKEPTS